MTTVREAWGLSRHPHIPVGNKGFFCGCEFEIEDIKDYSDVNQMEFMIVEDHSLRNNGREFKTPPLTYEKTLTAFQNLHTKLKLGKEPFSERTSIHVHVNVQEMELSSLRQLILTYALFEPLFFEYVGNIRKNSIFCVPLNYTYLPSLYHKDIMGMKKNWHKYTALNLVPVEQFGTLEFRHLYGTNNTNVFATWLKSIEELYTYIAEHPEFDVVKAVEQRSAVSLAREILPTFCNIYHPAQIRTLTEDSLLDVKLSVGGLTK